jgi:Fcf2 pre-rRNA processing
VLDPKRHYKKNTKGNQFPEFSQVGTIVEGSTEFFSARIPNKQRKKTFVDEVLAGEKESGYFGRKYSEVQTSKTSGKKAFYKKLKERRSSARKSR